MDWFTWAVWGSVAVLIVCSIILAIRDRKKLKAEEREQEKEK